MIIIVGPTSSGKTSFGINLAKKYGFEIISADSRQIYRYMDIGTGKKPINIDKKRLKISKEYWEIDKVRIWGYDIVDPNVNFSAYDFCEYAYQKIIELRKKKIEPILIGGTGFYIDSLTGRMKLSKSEPDFSLRKELESKPLSELVEVLKLLNYQKLSNIDQKNKRRLIRAIEIEKQKKLEYQSDFFSDPSDHIETHNPQLIEKNLYIGLHTQREILYQNVDKWLDQIWNDNLFDEVKFLLKKFPDSDKLNGLIYSSVVNYLADKNYEVDFKQRAKYDLHAYVRRQLTWFKKNNEIEWFDISEKDYNIKIANLVESYLSSKSAHERN